MSEATICFFEVFFLDVFFGNTDSRIYRAEDEAHAVELFHEFHPDDIVESVEYRGEA